MQVTSKVFLHSIFVSKINQSSVVKNLQDNAYTDFELVKIKIGTVDSNLRSNVKKTTK